MEPLFKDSRVERMLRGMLVIGAGATFWLAPFPQMAAEAPPTQNQPPPQKAFAPSSFDETRLVRIEVTPDQTTMLPGGYRQLAVRGHFSDGSVRLLTQGVRFTTSSESVATVSALGRVVALSPGEATIVCTYRKDMGRVRIYVPSPEDVPPYRKPRHSDDTDENIATKRVMNQPLVVACLR